MFFVVAALIAVSIREERDELEIVPVKKKEQVPKTTDDGLCARIPQDGTVEWAHYVLENYSTEYFKPVDITRAYKILDKNEESNK